MEATKRIPYGKSRFDEVRRENCYYVDKTMFLPMLEDTGDYLFLIRPRRFGKSMFVTMMQCYYDLALSNRFDELFSGLWIHDHPTPGKNAYQVVYLDFSKVGLGTDTLEEKLNEYVGIVMDSFIHKYETFYSAKFQEEVLKADSGSKKLKLVDEEAHRQGYPLYLIIDEYDNFTNVILSKRGIDTFKALTHASGFYREYFKVFKAMFSRIFLIGVSPVTLDDLTSGYNIDWGISQDPRFNAMLGFSDSEVRDMFSYYQKHGKLRPDADIDAMIEEMRPWYDNYCFAEESLCEERVFNSDMVLYYLRHQALYGRAPKDMVDKNVRTDYSKLNMLASIDRNTKREQRTSVIEEIATSGQIVMTLKTSFPSAQIADDDNFRSLIYYYGMLTMGGTQGSWLRMIIPNRCVQQQYWGFLRSCYEKCEPVIGAQLNEDFMRMAYEGDWKPLMKRIANAYRVNSSVRDALLGEHNLQGFFKAYLALNALYIARAEQEANFGYCDFAMLPDLSRYPDVAHSYIIELKYAKPTASQVETDAKDRDAEAQLLQYTADRALMRQCGTTQLHLLKLVFQGPEMVICEEVR